MYRETEQTKHTLNRTSILKKNSVRAVQVADEDKKTWKWWYLGDPPPQNLEQRYQEKPLFCTVQAKQNNHQVYLSPHVSSSNTKDS